MISGLIRKATLLFSLGGAAAVSAERWPSLPTYGFISGRPAQKEDVSKGDAIFVAAVNDVVIGKPLPLQIPQYALLRDKQERVILVQAEEANGIKLFGLRTLDGKEMVAKDTDVDLLGADKPRI